MLRENLEEEAIIMKDVPNWKVGPRQGGRGPVRCRNATYQGKPEARGGCQVCGAEGSPPFFNFGIANEQLHEQHGY